MYLSLGLLAYACVQSANAMNKNTGRCFKTALTLIIVGCAALAMSLIYNLRTEFVFASTIPLVFGFSLYIIIGDVEVHHKLDKLLTRIKNQFTRLAVRQ